MIENNLLFCIINSISSAQPAALNYFINHTPKKNDFSVEVCYFDFSSNLTDSD